MPPTGIRSLVNLMILGGLMTSLPYLPICGICDRPVKLETAKTDEQGKPVHEGCYLLKINVKGKKKRGESRDKNLPIAEL
jgi:hypothetical protein